VPARTRLRATLTPRRDSTYDLVVIGGGPAGEKAAAAAAFWGKRVAVVERSLRPGGALIGGATSVKAMREAALYLTGFQRRDVYEVGLDLTPAAAATRMRERTARVVETMADRAEANLARHAVDLVQGSATLGPDRTVVVRPDGGGVARTLTATTAVIIATGSRPFHPPGVPFDDPDVLDSDGAALLDRPLRSLVVVGGGAVGVEFA
jgi:NAD(P) transhydrogenase